MLSILSISASLFVIFLCHVCHKYIHAYKYVKKILFCTVQNRIFFTYLYLDNTTGMTQLKIFRQLFILIWTLYCHCVSQVALWVTCHGSLLLMTIGNWWRNLIYWFSSLDSTRARPVPLGSQRPSGTLCCIQIGSLEWPDPFPAPDSPLKHDVRANFHVKYRQAKALEFQRIGLNYLDSR